MSCLSIMQDVCNTLGEPAPTTIETSNSATAIIMLGQLNRAGKEILNYFDWQELTRQASFVTNGASEYTITASPVSITDYYSLITPYLYDRTDGKVILNIGDNEYQLRQTYSITAVANYRFRIIANKIQFDTAVPTTHTITFEYKSKNWVIPTSGSDKAAFTLDADTSYLNEELLTLGLIAKYKNKSGMTYDEEYRDYKEMLKSLKDSNKPQRLIKLARASVDWKYFPYNYELKD